MTNINPNEIYVYAATSDKFAETAKAYMGPWYDCLESQVDGYDLGQIVLYQKNFWLGAALWRRTKRKSYPRDRWLGWHACQQAERLPLVIECLGFQPMHHAPDQPNFGNLALNAAISSLPLDWADYIGDTPLLLADTHLKASSGFTGYFKETGWTRTTDKNPRAAASHWVKELIPDARAIITAKHLDKAYTGGTSPYVDGLLPIKDELLSSFSAAFKEMHDPRENNSHYPLHTLLAITFLALISGSTSINGIVKFSNRLSFNQAQLLGLPFSKDGSTFDLPKYHSYYRLLWRLDIMQLAPFFINWLNTHMAQLPGVLHPDGDIVRDTLFAFNRFRAPPSTWAIKLDYETPVGIDPDAPDGFKRDAAGNLID